MKKTIILLVAVFILIPSITLAATPVKPVDLEAQKIQLMEQIIVLLKARIELLMAQLGQRQAVLGVSTSTALTISATTTPNIIKKKRTGGGGGGGGSSSGGNSSSSPDPLVLSMTAIGDNVFTVNANQTLEPVSIVVTGLSTSLNVWEYISQIPSTLVLRAKLSNGDYYDVTLVLDLGQRRYTADMRALLPQGISFTGEFEIIVPEFFQPAYIEYSVFIETNGVTRTIVLSNPGETELFMLTSSNNPDASTIGVQATEVSDLSTIFAFDVANIGGASSELKEITFDFEFSPEVSSSDLLSEAILYIEGDLINGEIGTSSITFDEIDYILSGDTITPLELMISFMPLNGDYEEGQEISFSLESNNIKAEREDNENNVLVFGDTLFSEVHTLRSSGMVVNLDSENADVTSVDGNLNDYATYEIELEITAFEQDVYITNDSGISVSRSIRDSSGSPVSIGVTTSALSSTADEEGDYFVVNEGNTETFTLTVTFSPGVSNNTVRLQLESIQYASSATTPNQIWVASPLSDYRTSLLTIVN